MNLRFKLGLARAVLVTAVLLPFLALGATLARASPLDPNATDWEGLSELVAIAQGELGKDRVVASPKLDLGTLDRADALLLVHPERHLDADELSSFMRQGGRVILLDDYGSGDGLLAYFGIQRVPLPGRPALMLRDNPALAIAESTGRHASFRDADRVVVNHATGLARASLSPLLVVRGEGEPDVLLALAGDVGLGNLIAVGDSSIAMNSMLRYPGNRAFALALVRYAMQTRASPNPGKLYLLVNDFDLAGWYGSPHGGPLGQAYQAVARGLQGLRTDGLSPAAAYALALAVGLGVLYWTTTRAGRTHRPTVPRFVRPVPLAAQGGVAGHAAAIGAPGATRAAVMLELKTAVEEYMATRMSLERTPTHEELVARARALGWITPDDARALARLLASLARVETMVSARTRAGVERIRDADVLAVAARVRALLSAMEARGRDKVTGPP